MDRAKAAPAEQLTPRRRARRLLERTRPAPCLLGADLGDAKGPCVVRPSVVRAIAAHLDAQWRSGDSRPSGTSIHDSPTAPFVAGFVARASLPPVVLAAATCYADALRRRHPRALSTRSDVPARVFLAAVVIAGSHLQSIPFGQACVRGARATWGTYSAADVEAMATEMAAHLSSAKPLTLSAVEAAARRLAEDAGLAPLVPHSLSIPALLCDAE